MKNSASSVVSISVICLVVWMAFYTTMPRYKPEKVVPLSEFSTKRALNHIAFLSKKPHYVGTKPHHENCSYLQSELQKLGLKPEIQEGYTLTEWGNLAKSKNILAKIKGTQSEKALLLLSHYDSALHSKSHGAADDACGIATILEGIRAFLHNKSAPKNDIIILFSDAEELGLNGAALFVTQHDWAKEVGFALNFEARGTSGPAYMLMETTKGNQEIVTQFANTGVPFPASNSLMYSIYKMLPNDTDLTVFREHGNIQGLNFAFIDNHFNYHTQQDDFAHLNPDSVEHQGSYLMPLLTYFSNTDLSTLHSDQDDVYFNIPFGFIHYPFTLNWPLAVISIVLFLGAVFLGFGKRILSAKEIGKGFLLVLQSVIVSGAIGFFGWKLITISYPDYKEILQNFTYNGHDYIAAFLFLTLAICLFFYRKLVLPQISVNYSVAPIFLWLIINTCVVMYLPGASFFIFPVLASLLGLAYFVVTQRLNPFLHLILGFPTLILLVPYTFLFPVGLGLKIIFGSAILLSLAFGLLIPVISSIKKKGLLSMLCMIISIVFFVKAHLGSGFDTGKAKPNSLMYFLDADTRKAYWATCDAKPDQWTEKYLGNNPKNAAVLNRNPLFSKYDSAFSLCSDATLKPIVEPEISFIRDTVNQNQHYYSILIRPKRNVTRYDIFADEKLVFHNLRTNGVANIQQKGSKYKRHGRKLLSYYVVDNTPLELRFSIPKDAVLDMELMESSFDLLENPLFTIAPREDWMMPKPFVLSDAVIIQKKIRPTVKTATSIQNDPINDSN